MNCKDAKIEMPGLLFGEISETERERLMKHITGCKDCKREWSELKATEAVMLELGEEEPPRDIVFVNEEKPAPVWQRVLDFVLGPGVPRWGFAIGMVIIAMWIAKPNVSVKDGSFALAFGKTQPAKTMPQQDIQELLRQERLETLQMVSGLLDQNNEEMRRDYTLTLAAFARDLDRQRTNDLTWMQTGLTDVQRNTEAGFRQTNMVIEDLLKNASLKNGDLERLEQ